jgi:hypothetical protein
MGASSWRYYTKYRPDPEAALQELRQDVFARGDYSFGFGGFAKASDSFTQASRSPQAAAQMIAGLSPNDPHYGHLAKIFKAALSGDFTGLNGAERQTAESLRPMFQKQQQMGTIEDDDEDAPGENERPETIEELLEMVAEDGTHSVLDIERVGESPEFGVAAPLTQSLIERAFGGARPTHDQVEAKWDQIAEPLDRWQAYYVTIYKDGEPAEYAFIGCSGD